MIKANCCGQYKFTNNSRYKGSNIRNFKENYKQPIQMYCYSRYKCSRYSDAFPHAKLGPFSLRVGLLTGRPISGPGHVERGHRTLGTVIGTIYVDQNAHLNYEAMHEAYKYN